MIEVSDGFKQAILNGKLKKDIKIDFESSDFSRVNFNQESTAITGARGNVSPAYTLPMGNIAKIPGDFNYERNLMFNYSDIAKEICVKAWIKISNLVCTFTPAPSYVWLMVGFKKRSQSSAIYRETIFPIADVLEGCYNVTRFNFDTDDIEYIRSIAIEFLDANQRTYPSSFTGRVSFDYEYKEAQINIGLTQSQMPYDFENTVQVQRLGLNPSDYIKITNIQIPNILAANMEKESFKLTESLCSKNVLKYGACEAAICEFDAVNIGDDDLIGNYFKASLSVEGINETLPLGRFRIGNVTKTGAHNTVKKHIEAYDGMRPLDIDVTNWYSGYMGGVTSDRVQYGIEWTRQMFSTFSNLCKKIGLNIGIRNEQLVAGNIYMSPETGKVYLNEEHTDFIELMYSNKISITDPYNVYKVKITNSYEQQLYEFFEETGYSYKSFGFSPKKGGIWITEYNQNTVINKFCLDDEDYFAVHPNCTSIVIEMAYRYNVKNAREQTIQLLIDYRASVYHADFDLFYSANMATRLVYYNWQTREICNASSVSARNVLRSLIEITGGFLRYGRDGNLEYIQASRSGLYPSNNLYPADDLYPRQALSSERLSMGKYISFKAEDFSTNNFGKIQIKLPATTSKDAISKTYVGSATKPNTYIIDDNVFYCADGITYDSANSIAEPLPEVVEMMQNLYNVIMDMGYVPHVTQAFGLPWFECGDRIGLLTENGGFETFVFRRNLTGIQILRDTFEAYGEETSESIADYGIYNWK